MKLLQKVSVLAGLFLAALVAAASEAVYPVLPLKEAPVSAAWDASVWKDVPAGSGFLGLKSKQLSSQRQTQFKMGWNKNVLYVLVKCLEPSPDKIKTDLNNYRDGWYPDDHVEFLICSSRDTSKKVYKQFIVNSIGGRWCNFTSLGNSTEWNAIAAKGKSCWTVLLQIPFPVIIPADKKQSDLLYFNLGRVANSNKETSDIYSCFAPIKTGGFSHLTSFIPVKIAAKDSKENAGTIRKEFDRLNKWSRGKLWKIAYVKEGFLSGKEKDPSMASLMEIKKQAKAVLKAKDVEKSLVLIGEYEKCTELLARPVQKSAVTVKTRNASVKLFLDGKEVALDKSGKANVVLQEGFSVLGAECVAKGSNPGVKISLLSCPEAEGRWKVAAGINDKKFLDAGYIEKGWNTPASRDGFLWSANAQDQKVSMRQVLMYNGSHDGPNRCINPLVKEWDFSLNSTEPLFLMLNPPLKGLSADYEFVLDLPEGFRLLDMKHDHPTGWWGPKVKINCVPVSVTKSQITFEGKKYTRNVIRFNAEDIDGNNSNACILPVKLDSSRKAGEKTAFRYFRRIAGNFTEIAKTLPVGVLPRINGRMTPNFRLSLYCAEPYFGGHVSNEALAELVNTASDAGFTHWKLGGGNQPGGAYYRLLRSLLKKRSAHIIGHYFNYPAWRGSLIWTNLRQYVDSVPEAKARYFNDMPAVVSLKSDLTKIKKNWNATAMYCPTYVTTTGRETFINIVAKDISQLTKLFEGADDIFWVNWESEPWQAGNIYTQARTGLGSYCFCDKCKAAFAKSVGLPAGTKLSDEDIFNKYYKEWASFRYKLDGEIQSLINEAVHKTGRKYMVYSWMAQEKFWEACNGRVDIAFPGCPGNAPADATNQLLMDQGVQFLRSKANFKVIAGQRFSFFGTYYSQGSQGWKGYTVMSNSGYIEAKTWKSQVLRVAATMGGGLDLQSSLECVAGMMYYIGEGMRAVDKYESLFVNGKREDSLAVSKEIRYPNLLVLTKGDERLVLLFNEGIKPLTVNLENKSLKPGQKAEIWESSEKVADAAHMKVTIPENDAVIVHIK